MADFNFLPWREEQRELRKRRFWNFVAFIAAFGVLFFAARAFAFLQQLDLVSRESGRLQQQLVDLEPALVERRALQERLSNAEALLAQLESLRSAVQPLADIEFVSAALLPKAHYSAIARESDSLQLSGEASGADLSALMQALSDNATYESAELTEFAPASDRQGIHRFTLVLRSVQEALP